MSSVPAAATFSPAARSRRQPAWWCAVVTVLIFAAVVALISLSIQRSYSFDHDKTMYDPIYRWRESVAVALSRMQAQPLHGYLAYRSLRDHLNRNGLALMEGEATPLPSVAQLQALILNGPRMDRLLQATAKAPIDPSLPPVIIIGNEKGLADFYYMAFTLFGIELNSLIVFYYCLLSLSVLLFFIAFRRSAFCLFLLMAYLIGHYHMIEYISYWTVAGNAIRTVHNSRFFPVLSLLPALHVFLLVVRGVRASRLQVILAAAQTLLLCFVIFCRLVSVWQAGAVLVMGLFALLAAGLPKPVSGWRLRLQMLRDAARHAWPATMVLAGLIATVVYTYAALSKEYRSEAKTHVFWHAIYSGMVSASPALFELYNRKEARYSDNIVYQAVLAYLRERNKAPSTFAYVADDKIHINPMKDMGDYDRYVRRVFFRTVLQHPWLAAQAFLYYMPLEQIRLLKPLHVFEPRVYRTVYLLALLAALLSLLLAVPQAGRKDILMTVAAGIIGVALSSLTTLVSPTPLIVDTILFYLIMAVLLTAYLPLLGLAVLGRRLLNREKLRPAFSHAASDG